MSLENVVNDFLAPVKWADEQVLRQYTKLTMKWEEKGRSRYSLASIFNLSSVGTLFLWKSFHKLPPLELTMEILYCYFGLGFDLSRNIFEAVFHGDTSIDGTATESSPNLYFYKKVGNTFRFPLFVSGLTFLGKGIYEGIDYIKSGNQESLMNSFSDLHLGYSFFGLASSIYVKACDPKLLQKQPFWKTAYDWCKGKLSGIIPEPTLQPVPVNAVTIENYV